MPDLRASPNMIRRLLNSAPELADRWQAARADDEDEPLDYMQATAFAQVVVDAFVEGQTEFIQPLFDELERLLVVAEDEDRNLLVVGFIEDLQAAIGWAHLDTGPFYSRMGPTSRAEWDELVAMWNEIRRKQANGELPRGRPMPEVSDPKLRQIIKGIYRPPSD